MEKIKISASKPYDVIVGREILKDIGNYIKGRKVAIITDDRVDALYSETVQKSIADSGACVCKYVFKNGEDSKNIGTLSDILEYLAKEKLTRSDVLVALGGGVVGDMAGFAAAVYLRGIEVIQIPTTFLAAIDSSVGGKTAVNLGSGKNLAGAFWQPSLVFCDCDTFKTLPNEVFLDGVAEAIKYGIILDEKIANALQGGQFNAQDIAVACIKIKGKLIGIDEFDIKERQILNFGHTIGHAIEKCSNYSISHGHAIAIGMVAITRATDRLGFSKDCLEKVKGLIESCGLPTSCEFSANELLNVMMSDKKRSGDSIILVLPKKIGECVLHRFSVDELPSILKFALDEVN